MNGINSKLAHGSKKYSRPFNSITSSQQSVIEQYNNVMKEQPYDNEVSFGRNDGSVLNAIKV